ncbi:MAG: ribonuclease E/G, partial [Actinomycetes bacterium]
MADEEKPSLRKRFRIATFSASEDSPTPVVETPVGSPSVAFQQAVVPPRAPGANKPDSENKEERGLLRRARGVRRRRGSEDETETNETKENNFTKDDDATEATHRRVRKRVRATDVNSEEVAAEDPNTVVRVRAPREKTSNRSSTRIDAKRQRRKDGRDSGRRRTPVLTEAEFLARRESVDRVMVVRQNLDRIQIAVLEDNMLVEHYVSRGQSASLIGNVYLGKVQNVLPSMEAAFIDIGRGRNGVLYAGEVNWDAAGLDGQPKRIELALKTNDSVLVQVTKDPVGQKGARLTSQISLPGRYLVYVPDGS